MPTRQQGMFGLGNETEEQMLARRSHERAKRTMDSVQSVNFRHHSEQIASQIGASLGLAIGQKIRPTQLGPEEQAQIALRDNANAKFTERVARAREEGRELTPEDRALEMGMAAAEAHFEAGNIEQYSQIVLQTAEARRARQMAELQRRHLQANVTVAEYEAANLEALQLNPGDHSSILLPGEDGRYNLDDPHPIAGMVQEDGTVTIQDADGNTTSHNQWIPLNDAIQLRRLGEAGMRSAAAQATRDLWTAFERTDAGEFARGVRQHARIIGDIVDMVEELSLQGRDPNAIFGSTGAVIRTAENMRSFIASAGSRAQDLVDEEGRVLTSNNMTTDAEIRRLERERPEIADAISRIRLPAGIAEGPEAHRYRGAVVSLAYAVARANKPGGNRLHVADFRNALEQIGANAGDARSMLQTVTDNFSRLMEDYLLRTEQAYNRGSMGNMTRREVDLTLFGLPLDDALERHRNLQQRVGNLMGSTSLEDRIRPEFLQGDDPIVPQVEGDIQLPDNPEDLPGWDDLTEEEQEQVRRLWQ